MINKRLIDEIGSSKKYIYYNVLFQWIGLVSNIIFVVTIAGFIEKLMENKITNYSYLHLIYIFVVVILMRVISIRGSSKMSFLSSSEVKSVLRQKIYRKLVELGSSYQDKVSTSEVVQIAVEGVDQLDVYFGAYLPQFFYSMIAPLTLFLVLSFTNVFVARILLICVPLIPITIAAVQTFAKKLLRKYWDQYATLGDIFLENLQGLTTLKIYEADGYKNQVMNENAEKFRKITMKVLTMQLNSITVMDIIAFGGAGLGIIAAIIQYRTGAISLSGCLMIILLSAEFFIPMRILGSFFHIAMNGMAASKKIFNLLDISVPRNGGVDLVNPCKISISQLGFSYYGDRQILKDVNMTFENGRFTAIVGESGSGKSTIASLLIGRNKQYLGSVKIENIELENINETSLLENITYISFDSHIFKGTVRDNLYFAKCESSDDDLWNVLNKVRLLDFLRSQNGLDTVLDEKGSNLSGGQKQRLVLARAILHDSPIYIFDEATSNIDVESEEEILRQIYELSKHKMVIFITHRLANVENAHEIYVMDNGEMIENGSHKSLLKSQGKYSELWNSQKDLESYGGRVNYEI